MQGWPHRANSHRQAEALNQVHLDLLPPDFTPEHIAFDPLPPIDKCQLAEVLCTELGAVCPVH